MTVKKSYMKSKNVCRVTFSLPGRDFVQAHVVGDFNDWDRQATPMKKGKEGYSATVDLQPGQEYQFRYLIDGEKWANDEAADNYAATCFPDAQNCVVRA